MTVQYFIGSYRDNPELVESYFDMRDAVYASHPNGQGYKGERSTVNNYHYIIAFEEKNISVAGAAIEFSPPNSDYLLHFQRREIFDSLDIHFPYLDHKRLCKAEVSYVAVRSDYQGRGIGQELIAQAYRHAAEQHADATFVMANIASKAESNAFFIKAADRNQLPVYEIAQTDLITSRWEERRNTKSLLVVAHNKEVESILKRLKMGEVPWEPRNNNRIRFASPYPLQRPDAVLWDYDDTLVDQIPLWAAAVSQTLRDLKRDGVVIPSNVRWGVPQSPRAYLENLLPPEQVEGALEKLNHYYEVLAPEIVSLKPGALENLELLARYNIPIAVITNARGPHPSNQLRYLLENKFGSFPIIENAKKPCAQGIKDALKELHIKPSKRVLYIGDSGTTDMMAALRAGVQPILFSAADINFVNRAGQDGKPANIGFVGGHEELHKMLSACCGKENAVAQQL